MVTNILVWLMFFPLALGIHYRQFRAKQSAQTDPAVDAPDRAKTPRRGAIVQHHGSFTIP